MNRQIPIACAAIVFIALAAPACSQVLKEKGKNANINAIGHRNIAKDPNFYSIEKEKELGKQLSQEVERSSKIISDPTTDAYLDHITQNLARNSDSRFPISIRLIQSNLPSGFALPGGYIYINTGLVLRAENESQLAGAIAFLVGYVALRQGTTDATRGDIMQLASIPAMIYVPYSWAGYGIYEGMNLAIPLAFLQTSRKNALEADYFGLQYLYKAGYDPQPYVQFAQEIFSEAYGKQHAQQTFSLVPDPKTRITAMQSEIAKILPVRQSAIVNTAEFDSARKRLAQILQTFQVGSSEPYKPTLRKSSDAPEGP